VSEKQGGISRFSLSAEPALFLTTVNLYTRTRIRGDKVFYAFMVIAHNSNSQDLLCKYLDNGGGPGRRRFPPPRTPLCKGGCRGGD